MDAETCLYVFNKPDSQVCFLVVYVDDLLLAAVEYGIVLKDLGKNAPLDGSCIPLIEV